MKPNELQIGDWVSYKGKMPCKITAICKDTAVVDNDTAQDWRIDYDKLTPIPLTDEILEKNGLVKNKYGEMILDEELGTSEIYLVLEPSYDEEYYWWRVNNELITKIKSVHELQHILRLCNIDKEIEI